MWQSLRRDVLATGVRWQDHGRGHQRCAIGRSAAVERRHPRKPVRFGGDTRVVPRVRRELGEDGVSRRRGEPCAAVAGRAGAREDAGGAAARAHAGAVAGCPGHRGCGRSRHGAALRPLGQAAAGRRVVRGPGAVDPGGAGRQALRPRRGGRRLLRVCGCCGDVSFVVCLDSGGNDYQRLWLTTSLRGLAQVRVTVRVLDVAQHSGMASGAVPASFRVLRQLLDRIENAQTGEVLLPEFHVDIPANREQEARQAAAATPAGAIRSSFPFADGVQPVTDDEAELLLNVAWRPTLSVIGASGFPEPENAGNVLRESSTLALSFRLPPTADSKAALEAVQRALTTDVPYGAQVTLSGVEHADGWNAPDLAPWLDR